MRITLTVMLTLAEIFFAWVGWASIRERLWLELVCSAFCFWLFLYLLLEVTII